MRGHLAALASRRERPDHAELMRLLVDCPRPLIDLMAELGDEDAASQRHLLIEVLTRRYYQIRPVQQVRSFSRDGRAYVTADYLEADQPVHVVATDMTGDELFRPGGPLAAVAADVAASTAAVVDLYVTWDELTPPPAQRIEQIGRALDGSGLATKVGPGHPHGDLATLGRERHRLVSLHLRARRQRVLREPGPAQLASDDRRAASAVAARQLQRHEARLTRSCFVV